MLVFRILVGIFIFIGSLSSYGRGESLTYYYEVLGVLPTASQKEIQQAYQNQLDRVIKGSNKEAFIQLEVAYEVLNNIRQRAAYDLKRMNGSYYDVLAVKERSPQKDIEQAHRKLSRLYHPDLNKTPQAKEISQIINAAYSELKNPKTRAKYDFLTVFSYYEVLDISPQTATPEEIKQAYEKRLSEYQTESKESEIIKRIKTAYEVLSDPKKQAEYNQSLFFREAWQNLNPSSQTVDQQSEKKPKKLINLLSLFSSLNKAKSGETKAHTPLKKNEQRAVELFLTLSFINQDQFSFEQSQNRYKELLKANKLNDQEKQELKNLEAKFRKDMRIFKRVLSRLGLPEHVFNDTLLRSFLDGLKQELYEKQSINAEMYNRHVKDTKSQNLLLLPAPEPSSREKLSETLTQKDINRVFTNIRMTFDPVELNSALKNIRTKIDDMHFEQLKSNRFYTSRFIKSFPSQFIMFQAAIGAQIYRESLTDPTFYGTERNPGAFMDAMKHSLSPSGAVSFFIFLGVVNEVQYRFYKAGRFIDGKQIAGSTFGGKLAKALGPGTGLGLGFFVSSLFDELYREPYVRECVKNQFQETSSASNDLGFTGAEKQIKPCEQFYLSWVKSDKWRHYVVDIMTLVGSGALSHKLVRTVLNLARPVVLNSATSLSLRSSAKFIGRTVVGKTLGLGQFFLNLYTFMEVHKILDKYIGQPLKERWSAAGLRDDIIISEGQITEKLNNLKDYISASKSYQADLYENEYQDDLSENEYQDDLDEVFENEDQDDISQEEILAAKAEVDQKAQSLQKELESPIKQMGYNFQIWSSVRGSLYSQSFYLWSKKLDKLTLPYQGMQELLKQFLKPSTEVEIEIELPENLKPVIQELQSLMKDKDSEYEKQQSLMKDKDSEYEKQQSQDSEDKKINYLYSLIHEIGLFLYCQDKDNKCEAEEYLKDFIFIKEMQLDEIQYLHNDLLFAQLIINIYSDLKVMTKRFPKGKTWEQDEVRKYLAQGPGEVFSSDPEYSVQNLKNIEQIFLAKELLSASDLLNTVIVNESQKKFITAAISVLRLALPELKKLFPNRLDCFVNDKTQVDEIQDFLSLRGREDEEIKEHKKSISSLRSNTLNCMSFREEFPVTIEETQTQTMPQRISFMEYNIDLIDNITDIWYNWDLVFKQGESYFYDNDFVKELQDMKDSGSSSQTIDQEKELLTLSSDVYLFMAQLLCGEDHFNSDYLFSTSSFFQGEGLEIYNFNSKQYENLTSTCEQTSQQFKHWFGYQRASKNNLIHDLLFNRPVKRGNTQYETLYLALQNTLNQRYGGSLERLEEDFHNHFGEEISHLGDQLIEDLGNLREKYYRNIVNKEAEEIPRTLKGFSQYYHKNNMVLSNIDLFKSEFVEDAGFSVLEISIFQINYWLETLKKAMPIIADEINSNYNEEAFEAMQTEILTLLQDYHDSYKQEKDIYLYRPENSNLMSNLSFIFQRCHGNVLKESRFHTLLNQESLRSDLPVFMNRDLLLSHVLAHSLPNWNNSEKINTLLQGQITYDSKNPKNQLIYSILFEFTKSLSTFYTHLSALNIKEDFKDLKNEITKTQEAKNTHILQDVYNLTQDTQNPELIDKQALREPVQDTLQHISGYMKQEKKDICHEVINQLLFEF